MLTVHCDPKPGVDGQQCLYIRLHRYIDRKVLPNPATVPSHIHSTHRVQHLRSQPTTTSEIVFISVRARWRVCASTCLLCR